MLSIKHNETNEVIGAGVRIELEIDTPVPEKDVFQKEENIDIVTSLYEKSSIHDKLYKVFNTASKNLETFDKDSIGEMFAEILNVDMQTYHDIMSIIQSIALVLDSKEKTVYTNAIKHIQLEEMIAEQEKNSISEEDISVIED